MLNFSELNRKSHQIFQQQIKITTGVTEKIMKNNHHQKHGIRRGWYQNGQLWYESNYLQDQRHGIRRGWHENGQFWFETNYYHNKLHGISRGWDDGGKLNYEYNYHYGIQIEN